ncbi:MAG: SDR family oxidoreductase [Burkholderiales bacterium]|nr:SDR family oxidoreductase [Burkholderiales bacterium]
MNTGLTGRTALVTGGSKGIGRAVALALARQGVDVAICARGAGELEQAADAIRALGVRALALPTDMTEPEAVRAFVDTAADHFGRIDILVNNAVTSTQNTFAALSDEEFRYHIDVKVMGYIRCARAAVEHMRVRGWGRIVNVAGMTARIVTDFRMTNGIVNAAVSNFTKHLSEQVGKHGITVNAVHPGYTWTPRLEGGLRKWAELEGVTFEEACARRLQEIPIGRFIQPEDLANLVVFLCSETAGAITGQAIAVDGGSGRSINY